MKKLISNYFKPWYEKWEETMQTFPENKWFLQHDYIIKANEILMLDQEPLNVLLEAVSIDKTVKLPKVDWQLVLVKDDLVLDLHIPEEGRMDHNLCGQSIEMARNFFLNHFPEWVYKAFTCTTWLFDSQFQRLLPPSSNIVRFQQEFYLYPVQSDDWQTFDRVFDGKPEDFNNAPRDTSLRKAIIDHYLQGGYLRGAGGFILKDDVNWGSQIYQSCWIG